MMASNKKINHIHLAIMCFLLISNGVVATPRIDRNDVKKNEIDSSKTNQDDIEAGIAVLKNDDPNASFQNNQARQIDCSDNKDHCIKTFFDKEKSVKDVLEKMDKDTGKILIEFPANQYKIDDQKIEDMLEIVREIAKRDGQVSIEPVKILARGGTSTSIDLPLVGDILQTGYNIFSRTWNYFKFSETENYNAKIIYLPDNHSVLYMYFVHRNYGDLCESLYSRCDVIEYIDDQLFDKTLEKRLKQAQKTGHPVKISFRNTSAHLPRFELSIDRFKKTNTSLRLYKWFIASKETKKQKTSKERFMTLEVAVAAIKYSMQVYDSIKAIQMYSSASEMKTQIIYEGSSENEKIKSVIFTPTLK